jgi:hypothetical protein
MIACSTAPLFAQSAYADPADAGAAVAADRSDAAPASEPPAAPFAVVHPTYVPSQPAPEDAIAAEPGDQPRPVRRAPARAERTITRAGAPAPMSPPVRDLPEVDAPAAIETPAAVETPPVTRTRQVAPAAIEPPRPGPPPTDDERLRLFARIGITAILLAAAGFALGRRSGGKAKRGGVVAKAPSWLSVMPPDLDEVPERPGSTPPLAVAASGKSTGKRVMRGRSLDRSNEPAEQPHATPAARRGVAAAQRVVQF